MTNFLSRLWAATARVFKRVFTKEFIMETLKDKLINLALKKIFGAALSMGGFKVWLVKFLLENGFEQIIEPLIEAGEVEVKYVYRLVDGKLIKIRLDKAIEEGNEQDYYDAISDLYDR